MSVFASDEGLVDSSMQSYMQPAAVDADGNSDNPFGAGDGFADKQTDNNSNNNNNNNNNNNVVAASATPASASSQSSSSSSSSSSSPSSSSSSSSPSVFHDVTPSTSSSAAALLASLQSAPSVSYPSSFEELDESKCKHGKITVGEPELRGGTFTEYHVYKVSCTAGSVEHVFRRYSDFVWLRSVLVKSFPGVFVAPLPPKMLIGNKSSSFVEGRRQDLLRWLQRVCVRPFLADHPATALFLNRSTSQFEQDQKELMKQAENRPVHELIAALQDTFPEIARLPRRDDPAELAATEAEFAKMIEFANIAEKKIADVVNSTEKFVSLNTSTSLELNKFISLYSSYAQYENAFSSTTTQGSLLPPLSSRLDVNEQLAAWGLIFKWVNNASDDLLLHPINFEKQDVAAMNEVLKHRSDLCQRYSKSVLRAAKWKEAPPKNDKQEHAKLLDDNQAKDEGVLLDLVNKLILQVQFPQFWEWRGKQIKKKMFGLAKIQMDMAKQAFETWSQIANAAVGE